MYKFQVNFLIYVFNTSSVIAPSWMPRSLIDIMSTLIQVLAFCLTAPNHYLNQCCHGASLCHSELMSPYSLTADPLHSCAACTQPCNVNTHSGAHCSHENASENVVCKTTAILHNTIPYIACSHRHRPLVSCGRTFRTFLAYTKSKFAPIPTKYMGWSLHMMTSSNGNFSALLAICAGNSPVTGEFPTQRPATRSFDVFFDLRLNKLLSKQWWSWWFETLSRPLWRHCNDKSKLPSWVSKNHWNKNSGLISVIDNWINKSDYHITTGMKWKQVLTS